MGELTDQAEVFAAGYVLIDSGVLSGQADDGPHVLGLAYDVEAAPPARPGPRARSTTARARSSASISRASASRSSAAVTGPEGTGVR